MRLEEMEYRKKRTLSLLHQRALLIGFPESLQQAEHTATEAGIAYAPIGLHRFPDGESRITLPVEAMQSETVKKDIIILFRTLSSPNDKLIELILAAQTARKLGANQVLLVAPYLCYMRQDKAFQPGEAVSQIIIGDLLAQYFDAILTVDAHLHRVNDLRQAIPLERAINVTATGPMAHFIKQQVEDDKIKQPLLVGPDSESRQWVESIASLQGLDFIVADKVRHDDRSVTVTLPPGDYAGREVILVDDVASTGKTLLTTAGVLHEAGAVSIHVLVTHALFVGNILSELQQAGVRNVWSCDTISHPSNAISLASLIAGHLPELVNDQL